LERNNERREIMRKEAIVKIEGLGFGDLILDLKQGWECGGIKNGIGARFEKISGGFVIDSKSLKEAIDQITAGSQPPPVGEKK
jgi:hypothetical protein